MDLEEASSPDSSEQDPYSDDGAYGSDEDYQPASEELATSDEENSRDQSIADASNCSGDEGTSCSHCDKLFPSHEALFRHLYYETAQQKPGNSVNQSCKFEETHRALSKKDAKTRERDSDTIATIESDKGNTTESLPRIVSITGNVLTQGKDRSALNLRVLSNQKAGHLIHEKEKPLAGFSRQDIKLAESKYIRYFKLMNNIKKRMTRKENKIDNYNKPQIRIDENIDANERHVNGSVAVTRHSNKICSRMQRKRKTSIEVQDTNKKRSKISYDASSTSDDTSDSDESVKHHSRKQKPKKKKRKDSDEGSSTDTEDIYREMVKLLKKRKKHSLKRLLKLSKHKKLKRKPKEKIYKCKKCSIHFMDEINLRKHLHRGDHIDKKERCVICKLKFFKKAIEKHVKQHHIKMNLRVKDFNIVTELSSSESSDTDSSSTDNDDDTFLCSDERQPELSTSAIANDDDSLLYSDEHELEPSTPSEHQVEVVNNDMKVDSFDQNTEEPTALPNTTQNPVLPLFNKTSKQLLTVNSNEIPQNDSNDDRLEVNSNANHEDTERHTSNSDDDQDLQRAPRNETTVQTRLDKTKEFNTASDSQRETFKCKICDTSLLNIRSFTKNLSNEIKTRKCPKCNFSEKSLVKHYPLRQKESENTIDSDIPSSKRSKTIYKCNICEVYFLTYSAILNHFNRKRHQKKNVAQCSICNLLFYKMTISKHIKLHHETLNLKTTNDFHIKIPKHTETVIPRLYNNIIYKCRICEICFITPRSFEKHVGNTGHKTIKIKRVCTICDMVFTEGSLRNHLKFQHEALNLKTENDFQVKILSAREPAPYKPPAKLNRAENITKQNKKDNSKTIYKCRICKLCFLSTNGIRKHVGVNRHKIFKESMVARCSICKQLFSRTNMLTHIKFHHETLNLNTENDFKVKMRPLESRETEETIANRYTKTIYKCRTCEVHFLTREALKKHISLGHTKGRASRCSKCNLRFFNNAMENHLKIHHEILKLETENDFHVKFRPSDAPRTEKTMAELYSKTIYKCIKCEVCFLTLRNIGLHVSEKKHKIVRHSACCSICNLQFSKSSMYKHMKFHHDTLHLNTETDFEVKPFPLTEIEKTDVIKYSKTIFKCKICETCFISALTARHHLRNKQHDVMITRAISCSICKLRFSPKVMSKHIKFHHETMKLNNQNDFDIVILSSPSDKKIEKILGKTIYKCGACKIHFLAEKPVIDHIDVIHKTQRRKRWNVATCSICKLVISKQSMPRHLQFHHKTLKLRSKEEFDVKIIPVQRIYKRFSKTIYKCRTCEVYFLTRDAIQEHLNVNRHERGIDTATCSICYLLFSKASMAEHVKFHHESLNLKTEIDFNVTLMPYQSYDPDATKYNKTIYKCRMCEVHFLTRGGLKKHLRTYATDTGHRQRFNTTTCTKCNLLFCKRSIPTHLKIHHGVLKLKTENDFCVEIMSDEDASSLLNNEAVASNTSNDQQLNISKDFQLKECVVKMTDILQSELVSATSNGTWKLKQCTRQVPDSEPLNVSTDIHDTHSDSDKDSDVTGVSYVLDTRNDTEHGAQTLITYSQTVTSHNHMNTVAKLIDESLNVEVECTKIEADEFDDIERDSNAAYLSNKGIDQNSDEILFDGDNQQRAFNVHKTS